MSARRGVAPGARPQRQRGIALLTAIILVAIATILATAISWQSSLSARRGIAVFTVAQAYALAQGGEALAGYVLRDSRSKYPQVVATTQEWAMPYGPVELDAGATLEASLEDQAGKFNLNSVVMHATTGTAGAVAAPDAPLVLDPVGADQFTRLLELFAIDPQLTSRLVDWIDRDDQPGSNGGAEDSYYLGLQPAHRVPDMPITSVSELLAMGLDRASYDRIKSLVTALPVGTPLNLCTAPPEVLDAVSGQRSYSADARQFMQLRTQSACFPEPATFRNSLPPALATQLTGRIGTTSQYFRLRAFVTIGTTRFTLYSLLQQPQGGQIRPLLRTFGTE
jgi:general secretion pathway protein K